MYPDERKDRGKVIPGWRCSSCKAREGVRADTWLDPSKLPLNTIVEFIYWWSRGYLSTLRPLFFIKSIYPRSICHN